MEELLSSSLILVACISAGLCAVFIARSRTSITKHSRQRIKDYENDIKYLAETKRESDRTNREEIRRLQLMVNRSKRGETITNADLKNDGLGEVIMQMIPSKYRKAASFIVPQVEEAVKKDPALIERVYDKIKSVNTANNKQAEPGTEAQDVSTL